MLKDRGYKVRPVPGGELALRAARRDPPDLILLDINMPDMNGYEVCDRLKADDRLKGIPVIFISALTEPLDKVKAFATEQKMNYVVAMSTPELSKIFKGVSALPTTFVIDPEGKVAKAMVGIKPAGHAAQILDQLA